MRRLIALLAATIVIMAVPVLQADPMWLEARTGNGQMVSCVRVNPGDAITLEFTHSMFGGYVRETWTVSDDGRLERARFVTENAAAAEYYATDVTSVHEHDGWMVPLEPLSQDSLVVRVNQRGKHRLHIRSTTVPLAHILPGSNQVYIGISESRCQSEESE